MKNTLENEVERYLRTSVEDMGGECPKFLSEYKRGWPDRIVILPGGVQVWVETKRPVGGRLSPSQLVAHEKMRRLGLRVYVAYTKKQVRSLLDALAQEANISSTR